LLEATQRTGFGVDSNDVFGGILILCHYRHIGKCDGAALEAATGREAVDMSRRLQQDVVVMDLSLPELDGLDATRQILKDSPRSEILVLTMRHSEELVRDVL
jgi:CheY-like chemotaxis protein